MQKSALLVILTAFILGIVLASYIEIHWIILFTLWIMFICSIIIIHFFGRGLFFFRSWLSWGLIIIFFLSGMLGYYFKMPTSYKNDYTSAYLKGDHLIGEIIDFQKGKGNYDKTVIQIKKVVRLNKQFDAQGKLLCYVRSGKKQINEGNIVLFQPDIQPIKNKNNPGEFDAVQYWKVHEINTLSFVPRESIQVIGDLASFSRFWERTRAYLERIIRTHISKENQGLAIALALGNKSDLSLEKRNHFANAGAMHVLAVSGLHIGILLAFIQWIFKRIPIFRKRHLYLYFALLFLWGFAFLTGMSASVVRAVTMFSILAFGQLLGKKYFSMQTIFGSALILLIFNPLLLYDIGFQLSYMAILGIGLFYEKIVHLFRSRYKAINWLWQGTAIGIAAQIGTVPLTLFYFHQFPNYFILANIGVLIFASVALISVILLLLLHFIPYLVDILAYFVDLIFDLFSGFIAWINTLPAVASTGFTPNVLQVILLYCAAVFCLYQWNKRNIRMIKWGTLVLFIISVSLLFNRTQNKSKKELIVLNHNKKVILLKSNRKLILLYDNQNAISDSDLNYLVHGYETAVGLISEKMALPQNYKVSFSKEVHFKHLKSGIQIKYYDKKLFLADKLTPTILNSKYQIVTGAWSPYISTNKKILDTSNGALTIRKSNGKVF